MGQSNIYKEKYKEAKKMYLEEGKSLTQISKELHLDRGKLSNNFKTEGIKIINKQNIVKFNENYFDIINTSDKAYWLGFLYADGAISSNDRNIIELSLKSSDIKHLEKFRDCLGFSKDKYIFQDNIRCRIQICNKHLKQSLIRLGCTPRKSLTLIFPTKEQVPDKFLFDFIRGYIDGDGSIMIGSNHKGIYNKPRLSLLGTKEFIEELLQRTQWRQHKIQHPSNAYSIEWSGNYVFNYLDQLYLNASIYLDRKYEKYIVLKNCRP